MVLGEGQNKKPAVAGEQGNQRFNHESPGHAHRFDETPRQREPVPHPVAEEDGQAVAPEIFPIRAIPGQFIFRGQIFGGDGRAHAFFDEHFFGSARQIFIAE
ncbi:MAG: hypothetical protein LC633_01555 [Desulfobulbaceae bacterium]|nr:hypothetical protein [Desulfobulbaceae bacterium]